MADLIKTTDNLNEGRIKLNKAIINTEEALTTAKTADELAKEAKTESESTRTQLDNIVIEGDSSVEAAQARVDSKGQNHPTLKSRIDNFEVSATQQLAQIDNKTLGIPLSEMSKVKTTEDYSGVLPITYHDGFLWGFRNDREIVKSSDDGDTWTLVSNSPNGYGSVHSIYWTDDGEVLISNGSDIRKSIGWTSSPQNAVWVQKLSISSTGGVGILPWGIDGDGTKFIVTEYSGADFSHSRYVWISTDRGESFKVVIDKYDLDVNLNHTHMHGVTYDKWADRFFVSIAHGAVEGIYWSDDNGASWAKIGGDFQPDAAPTTLTATDNGIVCGSDSGYAGLYGIPRTENPADMLIHWTAKWEVPEEGVTGFAYRAVRDDKTGQVYVAFKSDLANTKSVIMAGTATTGTTLWTHPKAQSNSLWYLALTQNKVIGVIRKVGKYELVIADKPSTGTRTFDEGNVQTGKATSTSIAIGQNVHATKKNDIIIGNNAKIHESQVGTENVVIGNKAVGGAIGVSIGSEAINTGGYGVAVGTKSLVESEHAIAIGEDAKALVGSTFGIAIGKGSSVNSPQGLTIGAGSKSTGAGGVAVGGDSIAEAYGVAIGHSSQSGPNNVAIGRNSRAEHLNAVALGYNTATTFNHQVQLGDKHIEMKVASGVGSVLDDTVRIFLRKNTETNKHELCAVIGDLITVLASGR